MDFNRADTISLASNYPLIGHRGDGKDSFNETDNFYKENTIYAFEKAIKKGIKAVELDVICTKDLNLIVNHDFQIDGVSISGLTLEETRNAGREYFIKCKPSLKNISDEKCFISTLEDVLMRFPDIVINIEIKYPDCDTDEITKRDYINRSDLVKLVLKISSKSCTKVFFSSFDKEIILFLLEKGVQGCLLSNSEDIAVELDFVMRNDLAGLVLSDKVYLQNQQLILEFKNKCRGGKYFLLGTYQDGAVSINAYTHEVSDFHIVDSYSPGKSNSHLIDS